jgi:Uma2 family endonuclease
MTAILLDPSLVKSLKRERALTGADRFDEVWDGVYVLAPLANNEHQLLAAQLTHIIMQVVLVPEEGQVFAGCNVTDRETNWKRNYRCPDVAVFFRGNPAQDRDTHWFGGPDFAVEIVSPGDRSREKLEFYSSVGVRELLIIDRKPWRLELYRFAKSIAKPVGIVSLKKLAVLSSSVLPLRLTLKGANPRPKLVVTAIDGKRTWVI